jgi:hypothetical protein
MAFKRPTKIRHDQLAAMLEQRMDAAEANVFARELLKIRAGVFDIKFPELKAQRLIPRNTEVNDTDEEFAFRYATEYGTTKLGASYSQTAPRVDVSMVEAAPQLIRPMKVAYGYDFQEARVAARTGNGLPMRKANAARKAIAQEINDILTFGRTKGSVLAGKTDYGATLYGLANLPSTLTFTPATGSEGSKLWSAKTPNEIIADMNGIASGIVTNSNDVEHPNTLLLPLSRYEQIASQRMGDGSDMTVLKHFLSVNTHIKSVEAWYALDAAPNSEWTGARMLCYDKSPEVMEYLLPVEFEQFAPQMVGTETVTECHARIGGIVLYRPKAVSYGDGI